MPRKFSADVLLLFFKDPLVNIYARLLFVNYVNLSFLSMLSICDNGYSM